MSRDFDPEYSDADWRDEYTPDPPMPPTDPRAPLCERLGHALMEQSMSAGGIYPGPGGPLHGDGRPVYSSTNTPTPDATFDGIIRESDTVMEAAREAGERAERERRAAAYTIQPFEGRDWLGRLRFRWRVVSAVNGQVVLTNGQGINRRIDRDSAMIGFAESTGVPIDSRGT